MLDAEICTQALGARDARFDGLFFVGITSTRVYCRPVCPARVSYPDRRRFFESPAEAEGAGFRPCLRCRPELAPGRALVDAVPRLAHVAAHRIAAGALNGRAVADLARDLGVSARHLRRALEREVGVSPIELAQTHRLLLAKRLLADTTLPVTRVAYASGFQSLRRFNSVFRERYRMSPTALRRSPSSDITGGLEHGAESSSDDAAAPLRLTLAYREPLAWEALLESLRHDAIPGTEVVGGQSYGRTVRLGKRLGVVFVTRTRPPRGRRQGPPSLTVELSSSLVPELMPLLARLRHLLDLDAEPTVIDAQLERGGLGRLVRATPGLRLAGAFDGFEIALALLVRSATESQSTTTETLQRIVDALGEPFQTGHSALTHIAPTPLRVIQAGASALESLGVSGVMARAIERLAQVVVVGTLRLERGSDVDATQQVLASVEGISTHLATTIIMRALQWPDAFPSSDPAVLRTVGVSTARELIARAARWRPWRAYAATHLALRGEDRATTVA